MTRSLLLLVLAIGLLAATVLVASRRLPENAPPGTTTKITKTPAAPVAPVQPPPPSPEEIAAPHLAWADAECRRIIPVHLAAVDAFFRDAQRNTRPFAEKALSWGSKWRLVADHVPFTKGGRHETFLRKQFEELVFTPDQLAEVVEKVVAGYLREVESIESRMLVRIRADAADFPAAYVIARIDRAQVQASYEAAIRAAVADSGGSFRADVATELASLISGEVLAQVAVRLGVSAGVLGAGAASSWATFGIGVVVGVIVDQIITWTWNWYADPKGNLAQELGAKLDDIRRLIVDGSEDGLGLRQRLKQFAGDRAALRKTAVLSLLAPQPH